MSVIALDTNILLDYFLKRTPGYGQVKQILENTAEGKDALFIASPVILEIEWVLRSVYNYTKKQILDYLEAIVNFPHSEITDREAVTKAIRLFRQKRHIGFSDCLIISLAIEAKVDKFLTNDRQLKTLYHSIS